MTAEEIGRRRQQSHESMQQGIALLARGLAAEALPHFDRAIELREPWPWQEDAELAWMLAAAWINRSDALRADPVAADDALRALDRGIEVMAHVPLDRHPSLPDRLILAWLKRADLCAADAAMDAYAEAESLLDRWGRTLTPERLRLSAMLGANRARTLLDRGEIPAALENARRAVDASRALERAGFREAPGIAARALLCRGLAMALDSPEGPPPDHDWIAEATDTVEEALTLAKDGVQHPTLGDLVRYGAKIYRICQPQFLGEALIDWLARGPLAGDDALAGEMKNELLLARAEAERKILLVLHKTEFVQRQSRILESLQRAEARLRSR